MTRWRFAAILALLIFLAFPDVLVNSSSFVYRDFGLFGYPLAHYLRESFWRGEMPLWNPLNNCGLPFLAQWNTLACYPGSLIYLVLPMPWSLNLFCLLHLFLAGLTMFFLAFRWTGSRLAASLAGLAFVFSGSVLSTLIWPNYIASLAWVPAVILCCERAWEEGRRWLVFAAGIGAMQMLAGAPEVIFFTWVVVLILWADQCWQKWTLRGALARRFLSVVALVTGLSAVQLFPFLDFLIHSHRSAQFSTGAYAMPFSGLANYLVPLFHTTQTLPPGVHFQPEQFCLSSLYAGVGVLALSFWALLQVRQRRVWLLGGMLLASVWLSLGDKGQLYAWLRHGMPSANFMRYPVKFALMGSFLFPLLAAFGLKEWTTRQHGRNKFPRRSVFVCSALLLGCAAILTIAFFRPLHETDWPVTLRSALSRLLLLASICATLWGLILWQDEKKRLALGLGLLALIWLDGITHTTWQNPTAAPSIYASELPALEQMDPKPVTGQSRALLTLEALDLFHNRGFTNLAESFLIHRLGLSQNCNLIDGLPKVDGFYALYVPEEREVHFRLYDEQGVRTNLADFLAVSQVTSKNDVLEWSARHSAMPFVTAGQQPVFLSAPATLNELLSDTFNPRKTVLLPLESRRHLTATNRSECRVLSSQFSAHRVVAAVEAPQPALVVVSQTHYHSWKGTVDGAEVPIWRGNYAFQVVEVPAGKHEVQLIYRDRSFQAGSLLTSLTLLASAGLWWWLRPVRPGAIPPGRERRIDAASGRASDRSLPGKAASLADKAPACCIHLRADS